jgi:hypothetical protein
MSGGRKGPHIGPDLRDNGLNSNSAESWHLVQPLDDVAKGCDRGLDAGVKGGNALLQLLDRAQMLRQKEAMVFA